MVTCVKKMVLGDIIKAGSIRGKNLKSIIQKEKIKYGF
jgi:hypothetical protein